MVTEQAEAVSTAFVDDFSRLTAAQQQLGELIEKKWSLWKTLSDQKAEIKRSQAVDERAKGNTRTLQAINHNTRAEVRELEGTEAELRFLIRELTQAPYSGLKSFLKVRNTATFN
jgi:hypothetical protein